MTPSLAPSPVAARAREDLTAIRTQWGDLLAAIERRPAAEWPPREARGFLDQLATDNDGPTGDDIAIEHHVERLALAARAHPAPLNLAALDATVEVRESLFTLADRVADQVQRPVRRVPHPAHPVRSVEDARDRTDPARWHLPTHSASVTGRAASSGSRAHGLHWAAVWLEGRALNEPAADLFAPTPPRLLDEIAATARRARLTIERALNLDRRTTPLPDPCPWCGGQLIGYTQPGVEAVVECSTGPECEAPVDLDSRRRRAWWGPDLTALWPVLEASRQAA
ncbi:hypothetical protein CP973_00230 [Streptomyces albofaciens JCM 4342]|uniref:hypothetical protein n=1 Tax=Streptomyces albofaciens TaxID=66866 RepID=UPI00123A5F7C|nr:hypothetical protein [Streptomyces albofaciens]KAA6215131.1 hypothetical protein CP973_39815 [Streptomyces albofaciens JCM 4342]KAA6220630.1 hypothetical protein CP973_00230 [Streptomyces albofaciens JCM 4342]